MNGARSKTYYRPPIPKYVGLVLIVDPKDREPNTAYRPLQRRGKGLEPSEDPEQRRRDKRVVLGAFAAFALIILVICYLID